MSKMLAGIILSMITVTSYAGAEAPYKGQQARDIKALSPADIEGYLGGKGMGQAKAAELNHYPGPLHVLELTSELKLTEKQIMKTQDLFNRMQASAIELGEQLVNKEKQLDQMFADSTINPDRLEKALSAIGALQAKIRYVHLSAHLEQKQLLTKHQIMLYDRLRGYGSGSHGAHDHSH